MSNFNLIRNIGILLVSAACFVACTPEEYAPCSIPNTTSHKTACAPMGDSRTATCTADYVFDCDSLICGIYNSSAPFCTQRCIPTVDECKMNVTDEAKCTESGDSRGVSYLKCPANADCVSTCPEGAACVEWTPGTGGFFCLPADKGGPVTNASGEGNSCVAPDESVSYNEGDTCNGISFQPVCSGTVAVNCSVDSFSIYLEDCATEGEGYVCAVQPNQLDSRYRSTVCVKSCTESTSYCDDSDSSNAFMVETKCVESLDCKKIESVGSKIPCKLGCDASKTKCFKPEVNTACEGNEGICDGNKIIRCVNNVWTEIETCTGNLECNENHKGAVCQAKCNSLDDVGNKGPSVCDGDTLYEYTECKQTIEGMGWIGLEYLGETTPCEHGCYAGACIQSSTDNTGSEGGDNTGSEGGDNTGSDAGDETTPDDSSSDA